MRGCVARPPLSPAATPPHPSPLRAVPDPSMWVSGSFPAIAKAISPAFGLVLLAAAAASGISQAISAMACNARQLQVGGRSKIRGEGGP